MDKFILILLLADGSEIVVDEVFKSIEEVKTVINDYYSIRKVRSHTGYFEEVAGYYICQPAQGKVFRNEGKN